MSGASFLHRQPEDVARDVLVTRDGTCSTHGGARNCHRPLGMRKSRSENNIKIGGGFGLHSSGSG
jgi:hypothetical protein